MTACADLIAHRVQHTAHFVHDQLAREPLFQVRQRGEHLIHGWKIAQLLLCGHVTMVYRDGVRVQPCYLPSFMDPITLLVIANPSAPHLRRSSGLPEPVNIQAGNDPEFLKAHAPDADVILNAGLKADLLRVAYFRWRSKSDGCTFYGLASRRSCFPN